ncbi:CD-NTase-associated protein 3 [Vibrio chagasii]|nr:CD-NTase-associated protein 3 [Vibrio chagasii]
MKIDSELTYKDKDECLVVVTEKVLDILIKYRQMGVLDTEAAGVLLGEIRGKHLVVTDLSIPGRGDLRSRNRVDRKGKHHQIKVDECFQESGGTVNYLGEWHTHPEDSPKPSPQDRSSWLVHLTSDAPRVTLIVGRKQIWLGKLKDKKLIELIPCS